MMKAETELAPLEDDPLKHIPESERTVENGWSKIRFLCTAGQSKKFGWHGIGGDDHISWNRRYVDSVRWARKKFYEMLDKGCLAFAVMADGSKGELIKEFDPELEDIIISSPVVAG